MDIPLLKKPKPIHNLGELLILNDTQEFGNKHDKLIQVIRRRYGNTNQNPKKQWYYHANIFEYVSTTSKSLQQIPKRITTRYNIPENHLKKLETLLNKENN